MFYKSNNHCETGIGPSRRPVRVFVAATTCILLAGLSGGCLTQKQSQLNKLLAPQEHAAATSNPSASPLTAKNQATDSSLAAIEDFLQRTSQYRATSGDSWSQVPDSPVLFPKKGEDVIAALLDRPAPTTPVATVATNTQITIDGSSQRKPVMPIPDRKSVV